MNMEDAHVTISHLGVENLALFGVFDGHGGREVAAFCQKHLPDVLKRLVAEVQPEELRPDRELQEEAGGCLGKALTASFHEIDDMLRAPETRRELAALKRVVDEPVGDEAASSTDGAVSLGNRRGVGEPVGDEAASSTDGEAPPGQQPRLVSYLETSIKQDLKSARDKGALTRDEASQVMMKTMLLKRLKAQTNQQPEASASDSSSAENVGCTAVCILLWESGVICANAGDSRAVLCRRGQAVDLSHDHKPNDDPERRRIEAAGGYVEEIPVGPRMHYRVNGNLNLSRAIGDLTYKAQPDLLPEQQIICSTPDIICEELTADDEFIVLACDGIWDMKSSQEVCDFVAEGLREERAIEVIVECLLDDCISDNLKETSGLGGDNMTCVVVKLEHSPAQ